MSGISGVSGLSGASGIFDSSLDWYVDSVNGNDANSGRSAAHALQNVSTLVATGIAIGESIGLARGSHWRQQLTIPADVSVRAYGDGADPLLDASDVIANASFAKTAGQTNVYEVALALGAPTNPFVNVWEDGGFFERVASVAACDAAPGSCYPTAETGNITLYIHPSGSTDPTSDGKLYEYSARNNGLLAGDGCAIRGIHTRRNINLSGSLKTGNNATIINCLVEDGSQHNLYHGGGSTLTNTTARNAYLDPGVNNTTLFVLNEDHPDGSETMYESCQAIDENADDNITAYYGHSNNPPENFGKVTFSNCSTTGCYHSFSTMRDVDEVEFTNCNVNSGGLGRGFNVGFAGQPVTITGGQYCGTGNIIINFSAANATVTIDGLTTVRQGSLATHVAHIFCNQAATLTVQNCLFITEGASNLKEGITLNNASAVLASNNNIFNENFRRYYNFTNLDTFTSDYTCFGADKANAWNIGGTFYANFAAYQAGESQDANGQVGGCDTSYDACA